MIAVAGVAASVKTLLPINAFIMVLFPLLKVPITMVLKIPSFTASAAF